MDTKWKNNKHRAALTACACTLVITLLFTALLPYFKTKADSVFENPLTSDTFIRMLYKSNYVQYKYLREKADQTSYTFPELYVEPQLVDYELYGDGDEAEGYSGITGQDENLPAVPAQKLEEEMNETLMELYQYEDWVMELTRLLDYYAVDTENDVFISNSDQAALQAIADGKETGEDPYVYAVTITYDGAGNVSDSAVRAPGGADSFLKRVEAVSREQLLDRYDENGVAYGDFYSDDQDFQLYYKYTLKNPRNMKIVYAMTQKQYQAFFSPNVHYAWLPSPMSEEINSYYAAGVGDVLTLFLLAGAVMGFLVKKYAPCNRKEDGHTKAVLEKMPAEFLILFAIIFLSFQSRMIWMISDYQNGWFLPNVSKLFLEPAHLGWLSTVILFLAFFVYFLAAYLFGAVVPELLHLGAYWKEKSLLYRCWNKLVRYISHFYQELVSFDIGRDAKRIISRLLVLNFIILTIISMFWAFAIVPLAIYTFVLYFLLKKYVRDVQTKYQRLLKATGAIAKGNLDIALSEDFGVFESYKTELNQIQTDFKRAVDEEVKSQRMKSELITNVSHDLKTPLTAIITYINLLKEPGITEQQREEYLNTLDKKAVRLKKLIEDLFEVSKATTSNITLNYARVDIGNLMRQCYLEYEDRFEEAQLQFKFMLPEEKIVLHLDPQKTFRIFENLYTNIIKYALPATRVYVIMQELEEEVVIEVKNISRTELQVAPEELTERFVRGDGSRNTEGSGLGLAIAKSFTELQHGSMQLKVDGDLFKVILRFRKWSGPTEETTV